MAKKARFPHLTWRFIPGLQQLPKNPWQTSPRIPRLRAMWTVSYPIALAIRRLPLSRLGSLPRRQALTPFRHRRVQMCLPYVGQQESGNPLIVSVIGPYNFKGGRVWQFRCQRLPAPALISPLIDYVPCCIALLCLVVCITRRCQIISSFVPGGCCIALQMLMRAGVLSWIKPGERFRLSLGSVVTMVRVKVMVRFTDYLLGFVRF